MSDMELLPEFDAETGEVTGPACVGCRRLKNAMGVLEQDVQNTEMALRTERRKNTLLQAQLDKFLDTSAESDDVHEVFRIWKDACNHPKAKLLADRKKLIGKMIRFYGKEKCVLAVIGAGRTAYTDPKSGHTYDGFETIFKNEDRFERFAAAGRQWCAGTLTEERRQRSPVIDALLRAEIPCLEDEAAELIYFKCPACDNGFEPAPKDAPPGARTAHAAVLKDYYSLVVRYDGMAGYCRECWAQLPDIYDALSDRALFKVA